MNELVGKLKNRAFSMEAFLEVNHPEVIKEQKHLDAGSEAQAYWNYGALVAIRDILRLLTGTDNGKEAGK